MIPRPTAKKNESIIKYLTGALIIHLRLYLQYIFER